MNELARPIDLVHEPPSRSIVICIHGFTSTPFAMRELAGVLYDHGYDASAILLPGHGTSPEALLGVRWTDWLNAVRRHVNDAHRRYSRVFLCGQSMGAALSLLVSTEIAVDGIVAISAGFRIAFWKVVLLRTIRPFRSYILKHNGPDIKDPVARLAELHYNRMAVDSILQLSELLRVTRKHLPQVNAPLLLIHGAEDHTFPRRHQELIANAVASTHKHLMILENSGHVATLDYDKFKIHDGVVQFLRNLTNA